MKTLLVLLIISIKEKHFHIRYYLTTCNYTADHNCIKPIKQKLTRILNANNYVNFSYMQSTSPHNMFAFYMD